MWVLLAFIIGVVVGWWLFPVLEEQYGIIDRERVYIRR
jgi:hypothetical protein